MRNSRLLFRDAHARRLSRIVKRRGTATAELAVCVPLLVALVFGAIETANIIFLKQALAVASYEAAQRASARGGTDTNAVDAAEAVLVTHGVTGGSITISPAVDNETPSGTIIEVTATAPLGGNTYIFEHFQGDTNLTTTTTMVRL